MRVGGLMLTRWGYLSRLLVPAVVALLVSSCGGPQIDSPPPDRRDMPPSGHATSRVFSIAGVSSQAASACWPLLGSRPSDLPRDACRRRASRGWPAQQRHIYETCLGRLRDGTLLLCDGLHVVALSHDGVMRSWPQGGVRTALDHPVDVDVAPDGSVLVLGGWECAASALPRCGGIARVLPDGTVRRLPNADALKRGDTVAAVRLAASRDGGAVVINASESDDSSREHDVVRLDASGAIVHRLTELPRNPRAASYAYTDAEDIVALSDGAVALAQGWQKRVLRLGADNEVTVLAGGGQGFTEGAQATDVDIGYVSAVGLLGDDELVIGTTRGLLRLDRTGRIRTLVRGGADSFPAADDASAVNIDGRHARDVRLTWIAAVDALDGEYPLALTRVSGLETEWRLVQIAPIDRFERLAVALSPRTRTLVRSGLVEVIVTARARARIELRRGRRLIASRMVSLAAGRTRLAMRVPRSREVHVLRVVAMTPTGAIATHQLPVIPSEFVSLEVVHRIEKTISYYDEVDISCRRPTSTGFACTVEDPTGRDTSLRPTLLLRRDGLISAHRLRDRATPNSPRGATTRVFEPLAVDPPSIFGDNLGIE